MNSGSQDVLIALIVIGLSSLLKDKSISFDDAEKILFSPKVMSLYEKNKSSKKMLELIHFGTELEDINDLIPDKLDMEINDLVFLSKKLISEKKGSIVQEDFFNIFKLISMV